MILLTSSSDGRWAWRQGLCESHAGAPPPAGVETVPETVLTVAPVDQAHGEGVSPEGGRPFGQVAPQHPGFGLPSARLITRRGSRDHRSRRQMLAPAGSPLALGVQLSRVGGPPGRTSITALVLVED